jgi:hypothetical protein
MAGDGVVGAALAELTERARAERRREHQRECLVERDSLGGSTDWWSEVELGGRCGVVARNGIVGVTGSAKEGTTEMSSVDVRHPRSAAALRGVQLLVGGYLAVSVLTLIAIVALRNDSAAVNDAVWTRGTIVVASAVLTFLFARRAAQGSRKGFLRLRIVSAVMLVAIVVIIALPGTFPLWMKAEQAVCGLLLLGVALIVNGKHLRSVFTG